MPDQEDREWAIRARIVKIGTVIVRAANEGEAIEQFDNLEWVGGDDDMELVDWERTGSPREVK